MNLPLLDTRDERIRQLEALVNDLIDGIVMERAEKQRLLDREVS